jgi:polysaccharide deacetylase 2 family uncharacterized protein YibQ
MTINFMKGALCVLGLLLSPFTLANPAANDGAQDSPALIAIIIDDLGNQRESGNRVIALPGPVVCAVMPHTAYANSRAEAAPAAGKEVRLHLPMQSVEMERFTGPGEISLDNDQRDMQRILSADLKEVPHTVGVNNHMGSLITRHPGHMEWLMDELSRRGDLYFIDSYTTAASVAYQMAVEKGVPAARRNVFLDNEMSTTNIAKEFERLKSEAMEQGFAIGIGHPYPVTLAYLEKALPLLAEQGFRLVPVSTIVELQQGAEVVHAPSPARIRSVMMVAQ